MPRPHLGSRVARRFDIPAELDEWLTSVSVPFDATPNGLNKNALVAKALYLLRELMSGVPSPVSSELLDNAMTAIDGEPRYR